MKSLATEAGVEYFLADDGTRIPLHIVGDRGPEEGGRAVVMISGWTGHWQDWLPVVERIGSRFTCYIWQARLYDATAPDPSIERMGRDLQNLLDARGLQSSILMGHSMGALISWEYLRQFGDGRLSALCLIDQTPRMLTAADWDLGLYGRYTEEDNARFIREVREDFSSGVLNLIGRSRAGLAGHPAAEAMFKARGSLLQSLAPEPWIAAWQSFVGKDYRDVLPGIQVPTFLAYGAACRFYGPRVAEYVHARIRNSELRMFERAGHSPHTEMPDVFARSFLEFVEHAVH